MRKRIYVYRMHTALKNLLTEAKDQEATLKSQQVRIEGLERENEVEILKTKSALGDLT